WHQGAKIVWAVRENHQRPSLSDRIAANLYYWVARNIIGLKEMPATGADFWLMDQSVAQALQLFPEKNVNMVALLCWLGFRQDHILYTKQARQHGRSKWTLSRKLKLAMDTITAFSHLPIRLTHYTGLVLATSGFLYALHLIYNYYVDYPVAGWTSLIVVTLILGGVQMIMIGVLGEYSWRALDESRRRPKFIVESTINCTEKVTSPTPPLSQE
ncbi:MAG: glycosyltransferase, partial [Magnetococcales bacterium]|nr:glycosyltransferase [Magnetococcales bacterium]